MTLPQQFIEYVKNNDAVRLKKILKRIKFDSDLNTYAIRVAAEHGYVDIMKLLLQDSKNDLAVSNNFAIRIAADRLRYEIVELLLNDSRVDPASDNNFCIRAAARNGDIKTFKLLIKDSRVDPTVCNNEALLYAAWYKYYDILEILLNDKRVMTSLTYKFVVSNDLVEDLLHYFELKDENELEMYLKVI